MTKTILDDPPVARAMLRSGRYATIATLVVVLAGTITGPGDHPALASHTPSYAANVTSYFNPSSWNGYKIFLSVSNQVHNIGCDGYEEAFHAHEAAHEIANQAGLDLVERGCKVAIGHGTVSFKIDESNEWDADYHIPIHSNADPNAGTCDDDSADGTRVFYYPGSTGGSGLSQQLVNKVGPASPGGPDYKDTATWAELAQTSAPAAYLELAFHTHPDDENWLRLEAQWAYRIGWAIDSYLGYP